MRIKGQFNMTVNGGEFRTIVQIIWEARINKGKIIRAILYLAGNHSKQEICHLWLLDCTTGELL